MATGLKDNPTQNYQWCT